ncbi:MAG: TRASH domain-containing protein, partial [Candidatus Nitrosocaldus sp.]
IRATLDDIASLEELMAKLSSILGLQIISSQIVTKVIKDEQIVPSSLANVKLVCHYCKGSITGEPIVLEGRYYFCCTSCLKLFSSERHGNALES